MDQARELQAQANIEQIRRSGHLSYQIRTFSRKQDAILWLEEKDTPI
ncbi:hypothetical protein [Nibribacter koreensis]